MDSPVAATRVEASFSSSAASRRPAARKISTATAGVGTGTAATAAQDEPDYNPAWLSTTERRRIAAAEAGQRTILRHACD